MMTESVMKDHITEERIIKRAKVTISIIREVGVEVEKKPAAVKAENQVNLQNQVLKVQLKREVSLKILRKISKLWNLWDLLHW